MDDFKRYIYTDEKCSLSIGSINSWITRKKGMAFDPKYVDEKHHSGRISVHFQGFITSEGLGEIVMFNKGSNDGDEMKVIVSQTIPLMDKMTRKVRGTKIVIHDNSRNYTQHHVQDHLRSLARGRNLR